MQREHATTIFEKGAPGRRAFTCPALDVPQVDGLLPDALRRERPALKVLYMTGYTDDGIVRRGLAPEGEALIQKPFAPDELTRRVRELLDH